MIYRRFGNTGLQLSIVSLGTWALGGPNTMSGIPVGWRAVPEEQAERTIRRALDLGVNFFDTADIYGKGRSEELLGRVLPRSPDVIVATKVGLLSEVTGDPPRVSRCFAGSHIREALQRSLRRLRRDYVDVYQLHGPDAEAMRSEETWSTLDSVKRSGLVRFIGVSVSSDMMTADDLADILANPLVDLVQVKYNVAHPDFGRVVSQVPLDGRPVLARVPFEHGLLLGKYHAASDLDEEDHRRKRLDDAWIRAAAYFREQLRRQLPERMRLETEIPLLWLAGDPSVSTIIFGATSPSQVERNIEAIERPPLTAAEREIVDRVASEAFRLEGAAATSGHGPHSLFQKD